MTTVFHRQPGRHHPRGAKASGMSLIEVLVSVLIFSFGLLGLLALQARATQFSVSAEDTNRASLLANELAAAMWVARTVQLPQADLDAWNDRVANARAAGLPGGVGTVAVTGSGASAVARISITWQPPRAASAASHRNQYTTQVVVP